MHEDSAALPWFVVTSDARRRLLFLALSAEDAEDRANRRWIRLDGSRAAESRPATDAEIALHRRGLRDSGIAR